MFAQMYTFLVKIYIFTIVAYDFYGKNKKNVNNTRNTFVCTNIWVKIPLYIVYIYPVCHNIANGIEVESVSKTTDKHASDCSKDVCWGRKQLCMLYKLFIQQYSQRYPPPQ